MRPALVLVDIQRDYLRASGLQPAADALVSRAATLLDACRRRQVPVVHVWTTVRHDDDRRLPHWKAANRWICVEGTDGHRPPPPLQPTGSETIVHKSGFDAFGPAGLEAALASTGCDHVIVAGLHLHTCVRAVVTGCLERGLQVTLADDAVASDDPVHAACTRRWLADRLVRLQRVHEVLLHLDGVTATVLVHRSPRHSDTVLFEVPVAGADEVAAAGSRAQAAWRTWQATSLEARATVLEGFADRLELAAPDLARQMALEIGKPLSHGREESARAAASVRDVLRHAAMLPLEQRLPAGIVRRRPLGAVGLISPWNNPVAIAVGKIAPALAYGNSVVWKPAPPATSISLRLLALLADAGAPPDLVQVVTGDRTTALRLAAEPTIDAVTFTGSDLAGRDVQAACARRMIPLQAELRGNNAAIVWSDADLPRAAARIAWGGFGFAGQRCTATRRVVVEAACFERVWRELCNAAGCLTLGDPLDPATDIGPLFDSRKRDDFVATIDRARSQGGAVSRVQRLFDGRVDEAWIRAGAYAHPILAACDDPRHPLVQEESMAPLIVVQRATDFTHAIALCNTVRHGLAAALFGGSPELRQRFLCEAQAGILKLDDSTAGVDASLPFGGWKASGIGPPEHGLADPMFYTRLQAVYE